MSQKENKNIWKEPGKWMWCVEVWWWGGVAVVDCEKLFLWIVVLSGRVLRGGTIVWCAGLCCFVANSGSGSGTGTSSDFEVDAKGFCYDL